MTDVQNDVSANRTQGAARGDGSAKFDIFCNSFTTADPAKLGAIARVMSAYNAYLIGACGRPLDEVTANDVQQLGVILTALADVEQQSDRGLGRLSSRPL